jgi:formate dehydrogenase subunit gamma
MTTAVDTLDGSSVIRFDRTERRLHWANATLFLVLLATGMTLYIGPLSSLVGRRVLVKDIHVISGLMLPVPLVLAYAGSWRSGLRRDVRRLARWSTDDRRWLTSLGKRGHARMGKFNAGQKLNAIFVAGCIPLMLATGYIMRWFEPFPLAWRTGATFVHDWLALILLAVIIGHIAKALAEPAALRAMRRGTMPAGHVQQHHPRWWRELERAEPRPAGGGPGGQRPSWPEPPSRGDAASSSPARQALPREP